MIITIDGPAGSGKSAVAHALAERLGFEFLRTGLMYRAVTLAGLRAGVDWGRPEDLLAVARSAWLRLDGSRVLLGDEDVTVEAETLEVTAMTRFAAGNRAVREWLIDMQRQYVRGRNCITEGRDQGSLVFPDARLKIYLDATPEERARRRFRQKQQLGEAADFDQILAGILRRDAEDAARPFGALCCPKDAVRVLTDGMTVAEVVEKIVAMAPGESS